MTDLTEAYRRFENLTDTDKLSLVQKVIFDTAIRHLPVDLMATMYEPKQLIKSMLAEGFEFADHEDGGAILYKDQPSYALPKHAMNTELEVSRELISAIRFLTMPRVEKN